MDVGCMVVYGVEAVSIMLFMLPAIISTVVVTVDSAPEMQLAKDFVFVAQQQPLRQATRRG